MPSITERDIAEALKEPSSFGLDSDAPHYDDMFVTWSLGPAIRTRDSTLLEESNADALEETLKEDHPELDEEWHIITCSHWGPGWVDHLCFHAVDENRQPTAMFQFLKEWYDAREEQMAANEDDFNQRVYDASIENIESAGKIFLNDGAPEDWAKQVFSWLRENDQTALEDDTDRGAYPTDDSIQDALRALGWLEEDDDG